MEVATQIIYHSISFITETYHYLMVELADPRTNDWLLVKHPVVFPLIAAYVFFIKKFLIKFMLNREPFQLQKAVIVYNFVQVIVSSYLFYDSIRNGWLTSKSFKCQPVDFSNSSAALQEARGVHLYYMAKITELLDTVFFVLRKKFNQVSFLHLYHHSVMPMISWGATKYYPGGHGTFVGFINTFVHIVMYSYYLFSALGPKYRKYLWWKRHITTLQLVQFCLIFLHSMQLIFYDCGYPRWTAVLICPNGIFFYFLFLNFYKKSYAELTKKKKFAEEIIDSDIEFKKVY